MGADIVNVVDGKFSGRSFIHLPYGDWADLRAEIVRLRVELAVANECLGEERAANVLRAPAPAMPNGVEVPPSWKIEADGEALRVTRPDGVLSAWLHRPTTNGSGMYDLCMDLLRAADNRDAAGVASDEDAYVIERMGKLLAEIAVIVNGPEPDMTRWSYHDLPEKVRALKDTPAAMPAGEAVADDEVTADNAKAADLACLLAIANGYAWDGAAWVKPPTPPAPVQAAPQEGEAYQPVRFGGIRRPSDEALAAAFWEHRQRENSIPADLCDSNLVKFGNDIVRRARELAPYLTAHPSACELGAVREALEAAARSLRTIAEQAGKTVGLDDMMNVRGYANSRANVAELALQNRGDSQEAGRG